jgi:glycosyltransferase involved in cell wall biosynthesis
MKILHVIDSMDLRTGGPSEGVRNLVRRLRILGHSWEVVCLDDPQADYLAKENVPIHALGKSHTPWSYHPDLEPWLKHNLPRFDGVIINGLWQYPAYVVSKLARYPDAPPYFVYPHGMLDPWFQRAPGRRFKAIRNWVYWKLIEHNVIGRAKAILFTSCEEKQLARETFRPYRPQNEINVGYGVSEPPEFTEQMTDAFTQKCPDLQCAPYFLFLSRIHPKKGIDLTIKAYVATYHASSVTDPSSIPHLVIVGPGLETDYGKAMQKLATDLCPSGFVHWPGMLTGNAKWGALYGAEVFVLNSHQENFGVAVAEAMACATPVLISDQINIWREIADHKAGLVANDTEAGAKQVFRQWQDLSPEGRAGMKKAARECYEKRFGINGAAKNLLFALQQLIGTKTEANQCIS